MMSCSSAQLVVIPQEPVLPDWSPRMSLETNRISRAVIGNRYGILQSFFEDPPDQKPQITDARYDSILLEITMGNPGSGEAKLQMIQEQFA